MEGQIYIILGLVDHGYGETSQKTEEVVIGENQIGLAVLRALAVPGVDKVEVLQPVTRIHDIEIRED